MANANHSVMTPNQLILPVKTDQIPAYCQTGTLFMSGSIVHYISGAALWKLTGTKV